MQVTQNPLNGLVGKDAIIGLTGNDVMNGLAGNDFLEGGDGDDRIFGGLGADLLNGDLGTDQLYGGQGDDKYLVDSLFDTLVENMNEGIDTVESSIGFSLEALAHIENLTLTGIADINATGNALNNVLIGNSGGNLMDGGAGTDTMRGGLGDDTYIVSTSSDVLVENANEGTDSVRADITYSLNTTANANIENLTLTGTAAINATGNSRNNLLNSAANTLTGGTGADTMLGGLGNDSYVVDNILDTVTEYSDEGIDRVYASITYSLGAQVENLTLSGSAAINGSGNELNNLLTGNNAANTLAGGLGNDTYVYGTGDNLLELANQGIDSVQSGVSYTLLEHFENLTLTGTGNINGTANILNNVLTGNSADNTLIGDAGNDRLVGGTGSDTLIGGIGNDSYVIDNSADSVVEYFNEGLDTVESSITFDLSLLDSVENLTLTGSTAINGTGNALNNIITGNNAANILRGGTGDDRLVGGAGTDTLIGGAGDDVYVVDVAAETVTEYANEGIDTVETSLTYNLGADIENLHLTGLSARNPTGNALDNHLTGNGAANTLSGGEGSDVLTGGAGADSFVFDTAFNATMNLDTIIDFNVVDDTLKLENAVFTRFTATGALAADRFVSAAGAVALDGNDNLIYDSNDGRLYYDADGNGAEAQVAIATLNGIPGISAVDIWIV